MAKRSQRLTAADLEQLFEMLGCSTQSGSTLAARMAHIADRLRVLADASCSLISLVERDGESGELLFREVVLGGTWTSEDMTSLRQYSTQERAESDPFLAEYRRCFDAQNHREPLTMTRRQALSDRAWYGSDHWNRLRRPSRLDHCVYSFGSCAEPGLLIGLGIHRRIGDRPMAERERKLAHFTLKYLIPTVDRRLSERDLTFRARRKLPGRLRMVFDRLLEGDSTKQIGRALGLRNSSVQTYVRDLYRALGVSSRGALLSKYLGVPAGEEPSARVVRASEPLLVDL